MRNVIVTGGSRGIGLAIALRAARDGANIVIAAKTSDPNPKLPGYKYVPSILCWKNPPSITSFDFAGAMTAGFMVDAKITTSEQLRVCLEEDKVGWLNKGFLDGSEKPDEDPEYKSKVQNYAEWAQNSRDRFNPIK